MFRSLRWKLFLAFMAMICLDLILLAAVTSQVTTLEFRRYVNRGGPLRYHRIATAMAVYYHEHGSWEGVQPLVEQAALLGNEGIFLADSSGHIIADSSRKLQGQAVLAEWADAGLPIIYQGKTVGALYFDPRSVPIEGSFLAAINRRLFLAIAAAGLAALALTWLFSRHLLRPVEALTTAARRMQHGDLSQRVPVHSSDELGDLAKAFNAMASSLAKAETQRRQLIGDVAHELRTPLTTIQGYLEALRDGVVEPDRETLASLHDEAALLHRLIDDLQELTLAEAGQLRLNPQPTDIVDLIQHSVAALQPEAMAREIALRSELPDALPEANVDPERIGQVLRNLLRNALAYTPAKGQIIVAGQRQGESIEIQVRDTGVGIAAEHLPHIFERFYRADPSRSRSTGGAGLGLAIARQLVEAHGGRIWVESAPDQGSIFYFTLPILQQSEPAPSLP